MSSPYRFARDSVKSATALRIGFTWKAGAPGRRHRSSPLTRSYRTGLACWESRFASSPIAGEAYKAQLIKFGASEAFEESLVEMHAAKDNGLDKSEPRTPENTTPTSFRQWCEEVLKPAYLS
jgi:hypothetical protein